MEQYIVKTDNERIDNIINNHYGSLDMMPDVLSINKNITPILKRGDIINLPAQKEAQSSGAVLW